MFLERVLVGSHHVRSKNSHRYHSVGLTKVFVVSTVDVDEGLRELQQLAKNSRKPAENVKEVWIHLGVHGGAHCVHLEQCAYNDISFRVPDERGYQPPLRTPIVTESDGTTSPVVDALSTSVPVEKMCRVVPLTKHSVDPGRFLCNYIYFRSLLATAGRSDADALFVHVPPFSRIPQGKQVELLSRLLHCIAESVVQPV